MRSGSRVPPVERGQEPVARTVDLPAAQSQKLAAHECVVALEHVAPAAIAELDRLRRRVDDVGEEHGREHPLRLGVRPRSGLPDLVQEASHLDLDAIRIRIAERQVPHARELDESRSA